MDQTALIIVGIFIVIAVVVITGLVMSCPKCKKWWKRREKSRTELDREQTYKTVTHYDITSDSEGNEIRRTERKETVPVTRVKYRYNYECKSCSHYWSSEGWTTK